MSLAGEVSAPTIKPLLSPLASTPRPLADPETLKADGHRITELMMMERRSRAVLVGDEPARAA